jgi:CRP/FNR family transcriptional regulator, cyclic AMP receptor protein
MLLYLWAEGLSDLLGERISPAAGEMWGAMAYLGNQRVASKPLATFSEGFLGVLTSAQRTAMLELGMSRAYRPGQVMLREGFPGEAVIIIFRGLARVVALAEDGREILLAFRGRGDLVGEMAVLSGAARSATVVAATEVQGQLIRAAPFIAFLERSPSVANRVSDTMAGKLRAANQRRLEFGAYPAECRVARVLAEIALAHGHSEGGTLRIGREITQADLASLAVASVRTVEKVLRAFEFDGVVLRRRRDLIVTDLAALQCRCKSDAATRPGRDRVVLARGTV